MKPLPLTFACSVSAGTISSIAVTLHQIQRSAYNQQSPEMKRYASPCSANRVVDDASPRAFANARSRSLRPATFSKGSPGRMSNGQYNGHFCRCHTNQVLWSSSLARETVSRGSKLAAVTSFHCSIGDFNVVVYSAAADADCANDRSIDIFDGYSAAKSDQTAIAVFDPVKRLARL